MPPNGPPPKRPDGELPTSPPPPRGNSDATKKILDLQAQCYELAFQLTNAKLDLEQARQDLKHERSRQAEAQTGLQVTVTLNDLLRQIEELQVYKRAMESMAKQFIHPRMTALELAEGQLMGERQ